MSEEEYKKRMQLKYPTFLSNVGQAPRQWGLCYIKDGMYYPRFRRNITEMEAEAYVRGFARKYVIPNPTSDLRILTGSVNLVEAIVEYMEKHPDEHDLKTIIESICGEAVQVNDILKNTLNRYTGIFCIKGKAKGPMSINLMENYKEIMEGSYNHILDEEEYFHHFDGIINVSSMFSYGKLVELLLKSKNLVLTGSPGTGKTYAARQIAAYIVSGGCNDPDKLLDEDKKKIGFVQFHPSYDYTDFVEGLRPGKDESFKRRNGVFKQFCADALGATAHFSVVYNLLMENIKSGNITQYKLRGGDYNKLSLKDGKIYYHTGEEPRNENVVNMELLYDDYIKDGIFDLSAETRETLEARINKLTNGNVNKLDPSEYLWTLQWLLNNSLSPCVFIIDEINRGELSKIFGELFYSIEPDYRGDKYRVKTQYDNMIEKDDVFKGGFYIPKNVYIIGTMNDVDRGVETMDFAIRRRFAWHEVTAEDSAERMGIKGEARLKMDAINKLIEDKLGRAFCIGGSYFRKFDEEGSQSVWDNHLYGILYEYFRGEPKAEDKVLEIKAAYDAARIKIDEDHFDEKENNDVPVA